MSAAARPAPAAPIRVAAGTTAGEAVRQAGLPSRGAPDAVVVVPVFAHLLSNLLHYCQNITSLYVLSHVSVLSFQVAQTMKRAIIILAAIAYFHISTRLNRSLICRLLPEAFDAYVFLWRQI